MERKGTACFETPSLRTAPQHEEGERGGDGTEAGKALRRPNLPHAEEARSAVSKHAVGFGHAHLSLTRRQALATLGAATLVGLSRLARADAPAVLGSAIGPDGAFHAAALDGELSERAGAGLALRVHALTPRPDGREAVAVGRRPQDVAFVLDGAGETLRASFDATEGRRFSGHGDYSRDGVTFMTAEIDFETGEGVVVLRDVAGGYQPRAEFASAGVGPHELIGAGGLVAVANGAKEPKSEPGVAALGRTTARSNVALLHAGTGAAESVAALEDGMETLSLRHLVATPGGGVIVGAQDTAKGARDLPLVARVEGERLRFLEVDYGLAARFGGYVGQLSLDASGRYLAASGPVGGVVGVFDLETDECLGLVPAPDCCAVAADGTTGGFVAATGLGEALRIAAHESGVAITARLASRLRWDNHLASRANFV